ncbi:MAG: hypothetical protein MPK10_03855 [Gammaproteobacteria bacterium]|nr:hypothetical protein [Gammaproteobacteria bacterium]
MPNSNQRPDHAIYGGKYPEARAEAIKRTGGLCSLCGRAAEETHHYKIPNVPADRVSADDLTPLCVECHAVATDFRRLLKERGEATRYDFYSIFKEAIEKCFKSKSSVKLRSSCTTAQPALTPGTLPTSRRRKLRESADQTAPNQMTPGSANSNAKHHFGLTKRKNRQSR